MVPKESAATMLMFFLGGEVGGGEAASALQGPVNVNYLRCADQDTRADRLLPTWPRPVCKMDLALFKPGRRSRCLLEDVLLDFPQFPGGI